MAHCENCGGPITLGEAPVKCEFCDTVNAPRPKQVVVQVPVPVSIVQQVAPAGSAPANEKRCPHCKKRLVTVVALDVSLSGCGACGGIWVDNASARKVLAKPEAVFADLARRAAAGASGSRGKADKPTCAECPAVLDRVRVHGLELDVCSDHGTWFDAYELDGLVRAMANGVSADAAPTVKCQTCHRAIPQDRANVTPNGLECDGCWRQEVRAQNDAADAAAMQRDGAVVAGVVLGVAAAMLGAMTDAKR